MLLHSFEETTTLSAATETSLQYWRVAFHLVATARVFNSNLHDGKVLQMLPHTLNCLCVSPPSGAGGAEATGMLTFSADVYGVFGLFYYSSESNIFLERNPKSLR